MRKYAELLLVFTVVIALIPSLITFAGGIAAGGTSQTGSPDLKESEPDYSFSDAWKNVSDTGEVEVYDPDTGETKSVPTEEYVLCAAYGAMPASFGSEALKAQCVVIRTLVHYRLENGITCPSGALFCSDPSCCLPYRTYERAAGEVSQDVADVTYDAVREAAEQTAGIYITYGNRAANALFHASSAGRTASLESVTGETYAPYLASSQTPDESGFALFRNEYTFALSDFLGKLGIVRAETATWDIKLTTDAGGRCESAVIYGVKLSGAEVMNRLGLMSAHMTFSLSDGVVSVVTLGVGHGVGMSQYGAGLMSLGGHKWEEIIANYYPGTQLAGADEP